jgi:hypothetical protein
MRKRDSRAVGCWGTRSAFPAIRRENTRNWAEKLDIQVTNRWKNSFDVGAFNAWMAWFVSNYPGSALEFLVLPALSRSKKLLRISELAVQDL